MVPVQYIADLEFTAFCHFVPSGQVPLLLIIISVNRRVAQLRVRLVPDPAQF